MLTSFMYFVKFTPSFSRFALIPFTASPLMNSAHKLVLLISPSISGDSPMAFASINGLSVSFSNCSNLAKTSLPSFLYIFPRKCGNSSFLNFSITRSCSSSSACFAFISACNNFFSSNSF